MGEPLISIIVPVYNVEKYLNQCIDSIINQSFKDYELILVNDGSTDNSGTICDKYAETSDRIKVIYQENKGLSGARNTGIEKSTGAYLLFIDSDDYIADDSLAKIYHELNNHFDVDIVFLNFRKFYDDKVYSYGIPLNKNKIKNISAKKVLQYIATLSKFPGSMCSKLVRRSLYTENNIYFYPGKYCEDIDVTLELFVVAEKYDYYDFDYYYYRQLRIGSITNSKSLPKFDDLFFFIKKWSEKALNNKSAGVYKNEILNFLSYEYGILLHLYGDLKKSNKKRMKKELKDYSWLLKYRKTKKAKLIRLSYNLFGISITSMLLNFYLNIRNIFYLQNAK